MALNVQTVCFSRQRVGSLSQQQQQQQQQQRRSRRLLLLRTGGVRVGGVDRCAGLFSWLLHPDHERRAARRCASPVQSSQTSRTCRRQQTDGQTDSVHHCSCHSDRLRALAHTHIWRSPLLLACSHTQQAAAASPTVRPSSSRITACAVARSQRSAALFAPHRRHAVGAYEAQKG